MVFISLISGMILSKKSATFWGHALAFWFERKMAPMPKVHDRVLLTFSCLGFAGVVFGGFLHLARTGWPRAWHTRYFKRRPMRPRL
jgi:hypothetical protein